MFYPVWLSSSTCTSILNGIWMAGPLPAFTSRWYALIPLASARGRPCSTWLPSDVRSSFSQVCFSSCSKRTTCGSAPLTDKKASFGIWIEKGENNKRKRIKSRPNSTNQPIRRWSNQSIIQSSDRSINQSIMQLSDQSINQSKETTNRSIQREHTN